MLTKFLMCNVRFQRVSCVSACFVACVDSVELPVGGEVIIVDLSY